MTPLISVLVPIYNVQPYIERCVHSLMRQTFQNIEFIFVDDASPDDSISLLESVVSQYAGRQSQVHLLRHEQNLGLSAARNTALDAAQGEYICWCDSDDWVEPDYCSSLYEEAKLQDATIVVCDFYHDYEDGQVIEFFNEFQDYQALINNRRVYSWNLFCRFVRRSLLIENGLRSYDGIGMGEDMGLSVRMHYYSPKTVYLHKPLYHYNRTNPQSFINLDKNPSSDRHQEYAEQLLRCIDLLCDFLSKRNISTQVFSQKSRINILDAILVSGKLYQIDSSFRDLIPFFMHRTELSLTYRLCVSCAMLGILSPLRFYRYLYKCKHA